MLFRERDAYHFHDNSIVTYFDCVVYVNKQGFECQFLDSSHVSSKKYNSRKFLSSLSLLLLLFSFYYSVLFTSYFVLGSLAVRWSVSRQSSGDKTLLTQLPKECTMAVQSRMCFFRNIGQAFTTCHTNPLTVSPIWISSTFHEGEAIHSLRCFSLTSIQKQNMHDSLYMWIDE